MLTKRQEDILRLIIQEFTETGSPVGSKKIMEDGIAASSATIRNEMKMLEELGLLQKTHSSSGRMPSLNGYRYYVENLLTPRKIDNKERMSIRQSFTQEFHAIDDIISQSADILSSLTSYTAFSLGPEVKDRKLTGFRIVPLNNRQVIALIVTDKGNVVNQIFNIPSGITGEDLEKIVRIINDKLVGEPLLTVYHRLRTEIPMILHKYFQTTDGLVHLFDDLLSRVFENRIFVSGTMNLLEFDPNQDLERFRTTYSFMEDSDELTQLFGPLDHNISIKIGSEIGNKLLDNLSMIQASYEVKGHGHGMIALLGPTSMSYSKMFGLVDALRQELTDKLEDYYRNLDEPQE